MKKLKRITGLILATLLIIGFLIGTGSSQFTLTSFTIAVLLVSASLWAFIGALFLINYLLYD